MGEIASRGQGRPNMMDEINNRGQQKPNLMDEINNRGQARPNLMDEINNRGQQKPNLMDEINNRGQARPNLMDEINNRGQARPNLMDEIANRGQPKPNLMDEIANQGRNKTVQETLNEQLAARNRGAAGNVQQANMMSSQSMADERSSSITSIASIRNNPLYQPIQAQATKQNKLFDEDEDDVEVGNRDLFKSTSTNVSFAQNFLIYPLSRKRSLKIYYQILLVVVLLVILCLTHSILVHLILSAYLTLSCHSIQKVEYNLSHNKLKLPKDQIKQILWQHS